MGGRLEDAVGSRLLTRGCLVLLRPRVSSSFLDVLTTSATCRRSRRLVLDVAMGMTKEMPMSVKDS